MLNSWRADSKNGLREQMEMLYVVETMIKGKGSCFGQLKKMQSFKIAEELCKGKWVEGFEGHCCGLPEN